MKTFFYGDILGKLTSLCVCSNNQILELAIIRHVQTTPRISEDGRVCVCMQWKPGYPDKLPNNYERADEQLIRREKYHGEVRKFVQRGVV